MNDSINSNTLLLTEKYLVNNSLWSRLFIIYGYCNSFMLDVKHFTLPNFCTLFDVIQWNGYKQTIVTKATLPHIFFSWQKIIKMKYNLLYGYLHALLTALFFHIIYILLFSSQQEKRICVH